MSKEKELQDRISKLESSLKGSSAREVGLLLLARQFYQGSNGDILEAAKVRFGCKYPELAAHWDL